MINTLEQRKNEFRNELEEKYREREVKWPWQNKNDACKSTKIVATESDSKYYNEEQVVIQNEFDFYRFELALLFLFSCITFVVSYTNAQIGLFFIGLFSAIIFFFVFYNAKKVRVFVCINKDGIQLENEPFVAWENVIASYVLTENGGEELSRYLLIYHHNVTTDEFLLTKYQFVNKGMEYMDICFLIEYWKNKTNNK